MTGSTLVLVLTDVAGSTRLWAEHPAVMLAAMVRHHRIVHDTIDARGGVRPVDQGEGDAVFAAFPSALAAVEAVLAFQRALEAEPWPDGIVLRDRVGIHVGDVVERGGNLFGTAVSTTARIRGLAAGGQVLVSDAVLDLVRDELPVAVRVTDLGTHRLRDVEVPIAIHQVVGPGMPAVFPPVTPSERREVVLPVPRSSFLGRERELAELGPLLRDHRLVTVTGFGGMGKTRLAIAAARAAAEEDDGLGARFADMAGVDRVESIGSALADALGIDEGIDDPLETVLRWIRGRRLLLVLDNLEQLLPGGEAVVARLLDASADLRILATSREPLRLLGEQVFGLDPLEIPPRASAERRIWTAEDVAALGAFGAVQLLVARATAARRGFVLSAATAQAVTAICVRLDGAPLALELVAVRFRTQSPQALMPQLDDALRVTGGGIRDLPARQRTLAATIEWSVRTLASTEAVLLDRLSVFPGSFTADDAGAICGSTPEDDVLQSLLELADRSLVRVHAASGIEDGDRFDLLVPIREYAAARLSDGDPEGLTLDSHADHFARLARIDPDGARDDREALAQLVEHDWHNVRTALDRLHERGRTGDEVALSPMLGHTLQDLGREGTSIVLLRHAASHLHPDDDSDAALSVLLHLAEFEFDSDLGVTAAQTIRALVPRVERNGSAAFAVQLTALDMLMQDPCGLGPSALDEAHRLLVGMGSEGDPVLRRCATELWMMAGIVVRDERSDPLQAQLLAASTGREHLRLRSVIGVTLSWIGRMIEAEQVLTPFLDGATRRSAYPVSQIAPLLVLADIRVAAGRVEEARLVLDAAETDIAAFDQPWEHVMIRVQRAAIDRAAGDPGAAAARLEALLSSEDADGVEGATAFGGWLLAVIERERGRMEAAATPLRRAWNIVREIPDELLRWFCLLERSSLTATSAPEQALAYLAAAWARTPQEWVHLAVGYDLDALRRTLEDALGSAAVEAALADAAAADPVLLEWV